MTKLFNILISDFKGANVIGPIQHMLRKTEREQEIVSIDNETGDLYWILFRMREISMVKA